MCLSSNRYGTGCLNGSVSSGQCRLREDVAVRQRRENLVNVAGTRPRLTVHHAAAEPVATNMIASSTPLPWSGSKCRNCSIQCILLRSFGP